MDLTNIRKSVRMGRLVLVYGILPAEQGTYSPLIRKLVKSTNYDIVSSGFVNTEEAKERVAEEAKRSGIISESIVAEAPVVKTEEPVAEVKKEEVTEDGLQEKGQKGLQVESEAKAEETVAPVETPEETSEEVESTEEATEEKPKKRGRKKASK